MTERSPPQAAVRITLPPGEVTDPVSRLTAFRRTLRPLRVIADPALRGPYDRHSFLAAVRGIHNGLSSAASLTERSVALWRLEKLGHAYCGGGGSLDDPEIPSAVQPILHVGLGVVATEEQAFSAQAITATVNARSHPDYRLFSLESVGCIWALDASRIFRAIFRWMTRTRFRARHPATWPDLMLAFPAEQRGLLAHGFGRTLYFKNFSVERAIRQALETDTLDPATAVQGIAFAFLFLNHKDLDRVMEAGAGLSDPILKPAFDRGMSYALAFADWAFAGALDRVQPRSSRQEGLLAQAREVVSESRRLGRMTTFGVA